MKKFRPYIILLGLTFLVLYSHFDTFIDAPNAYMLDTGVDGLKNYFNPMYYLKYDAGGWQFSGMNYPFGEHLVFTDGQPFFTRILKVLQNWGIPVADHLPGIFNLLMFASVLVGAALIYAIARIYRLPDGFAIPIAVIIACFSPQLHRFAGHYALSYVFVVPLFWILTLKVFPEKGLPNIKALPGLILALFLTSLIHVYYLMIGCLWVLAYMLVYLINYRKNPNKWRRALVLGLSASLVPLFLFKVFLWLTDPITDRPSSPYGFFSHVTYWEGIFLPQEGPMMSFVDQFADVRPVTGEGWAYVGFIGFLVLLFTLFRWGKYVFRRNFALLGLRSFPRSFFLAFWAGVLLLFLSFGWPFNWGLEFLLDLVPPLKQFRSLGRFAWVFYYVFSMYMALYFFSLYKLLSRRGLNKLGTWMLFVVLLFWGGEMWIHLKLRNERLLQYEHKNILNKPRIDYSQWLSDLGHTPLDFQALLPVPTYFIGSEKFYSEFVDYFSTREGMSASYQTGLPLACGLLSRTSISQTMELMEPLSSTLLPKKLSSKYADQRPLLLMGIGGVIQTNEEKRLLKKADSLDTRENITLYRLPLDRIYSIKDSVFQSFLDQKDSLIALPGNFYAVDSNWVHFDKLSTNEAGSFEFEPTYSKEGPLELFRGKIPETGDWEASLWVEVMPDVDGFPNLLIQEFDSKGTLINSLDGVTRFRVDTYKDFVMSKRNFGVTNPNHTFIISLTGRQISCKSLLIRPVNSHIFHPLSDKSLIYNNFYLEED